MLGDVPADHLVGASLLCLMLVADLVQMIERPFPDSDLCLVFYFQDFNDCALVSFSQAPRGGPELAWS